jgi:hypothetical protein
MAVNPDVEGRVAKNKIGSLPTHKMIIGLMAERVAADELVIIEKPEIPSTGYRGFGNVRDRGF